MASANLVRPPTRALAERSRVCSSSARCKQERAAGAREPTRLHSGHSQPNSLRFQRYCQSYGAAVSYLVLRQPAASVFLPRPLLVAATFRHVAGSTPMLIGNGDPPKFRKAAICAGVGLRVIY